MLLAVHRPSYKLQLCEDANSKLVEVAIVADVELRNVLTMVWCRFGS